MLTGGEPLDLFVGEADGGRGDVLLQVLDPAGPGDGEHVSPSASVHASRTWEAVAPTSTATSLHRGRLVASGAGQREERHERDPSSPQRRRIARSSGDVDGELVLDADDVGDARSPPRAGRG